MAKHVEMWTLPAMVELRATFDPMTGDYKVERRFAVRTPAMREWRIEELGSWYPLTLESMTDVMVLLAQEVRDAFVVSEVEFAPVRPIVIPPAQ